jgi:hypothetical protein
MKIALWTTVTAAALALGACSHSNNGASTTGMSTGPGSGTGTGSSAPTTAAAPTDFVGFVEQQITTEPAFGSAPAVTSSLTTDLALGEAKTFAPGLFNSGDALPPGTFQASVACAAAGAACTPTVSADLNSTLN